MTNWKQTAAGSVAAGGMAFLILALLGYVVLLPRTFFATITFIAALLIGSTAFGYGILKIKTRVMS